MRAAQRVAEKQRPQRRATAQAREAADAAGPRTRSAPVEHRGAQREGRRAAEDHRGRDEAQRAGVGRAHRRACTPRGSTTPGPGSTRPNARCATTPSIVLDLPDTDVPAGRTVFAGERIAGQLRGGRALFARRHRPRRSAGPSASRSPGPTARASPRCCASSPAISSRTRATIQRADGRIAYLSQRLDLLDPDRTVAENLAAFAPSLSRDAADAPAGPLPVPGHPDSPAGRRRCPAANGCAPPWPACCTPNRRRSCCCSTSRPTTSIWSASASWSPR